MNPDMRLYKIICRGLSGTDYGTAYAVAEDPEQAYRKVRRFLDEHTVGFPEDREMKTIELLADSSDSPDCGVKLYV